MNLDSSLINAIVRVDRRLPDVRDTMLEALFILRRQRWVQNEQKPRHG
jgi:hypothetical protein